MTIHLAVADTRALRARVATLMLTQVSADDTYDPHALVPCDRWTPLSDTLASNLTAPAGTAPSKLVEIIRVPSGAVRESVHGFDPFGGQHPAKFLGYTDCPPGQRTTTTDTRTMKRLGVHLDNFDRMPLERRSESRRRVAANLGPGARYLILATEDIQDLAQRSAYITRHPHTDQIRQIATDGGTLTCLRIRIEPGEGYIAPTELIPHDGSTRGISEPSTIAFWLGEWPAGTLPTVC